MALRPRVKASKSKAPYVESGYGQVEPNHLSAPRNGKVYGQLPAKADIELLENGQFVKYDYANGVVDFDGPGRWMMVFNERKIYDERDSLTDFAMKKEDYVAYSYNAAAPAYDPANRMPEGTNMVPRVFAIEPNDIWTTNTINEEDATKLVKGKYLQVGTDGYLKLVDSPVAGELTVQIVKVYTMPSGQRGVKVMCIA